MLCIWVGSAGWRDLLAFPLAPSWGLSLRFEMKCLLNFLELISKRKHANMPESEVGCTHSSHSHPAWQLCHHEHGSQFSYHSAQFIALVFIFNSIISCYFYIKGGFSHSFYCWHQFLAKTNTFCQSFHLRNHQSMDSLLAKANQANKSVTEWFSKSDLLITQCWVHRRGWGNKPKE